MNHDIDIKKVRINCFRQSKVAGEFMLQMRVPGAMIEAKHLTMVQELCERFGNGTSIWVPGRPWTCRGLSMRILKK